jgi:ClpP class serine protease
VLATHVEYSKAMAAQGETATVIRSGKYKALGTSVEPLSALAKAELQAGVDAAAAVFAGRVATYRGVSLAAVEKMGQGRVFFGQAAADVGLVDGITTLGAVIAGLQGVKR